MLTVLAALTAEDAVKVDPVRQLVVELLVSYGGIAGGAALLSEGLKGIFKGMVGKENRWTFLLTFLLGMPAKYVFPTAYGPTHLRAWVFHAIVLLFVGVGATGVRDSLVRKLSGFFGGMFAKPDAAPASSSPPTAVLKPDPGAQSTTTEGGNS